MGPINIHRNRLTASFPVSLNIQSCPLRNPAITASAAHKHRFRGRYGCFTLLCFQQTKRVAEEQLQKWRRDAPTVLEKSRPHSPPDCPAAWTLLTDTLSIFLGGSLENWI